MNKRFLSLAAILAASAFVAIGCGGSDDSSADAPTKTAYITEADDICSATLTDIEAVAKELPNDIESPEVQAAITDEILPMYQEELTELRALTPPEGEEETTASIYDAVEEALQKVEDDPSTIGDEEVFGDANQQAQDFGLKVCGS
ncbi:MAG: hypothetical protein ACSLFI_02105 [Solirubrobacterales bacterium]